MMGYKVLITFDLNNASTEARNKFYDKLKELKWSRVGKLTTTWKCSFNDNVSRENAEKEVIKDLKASKLYANIDSVEYAFQMDKVDVSLGVL